MKRFIVTGITVAMLGAVLAFFLTAPAFASGNPSGTGQPNQTCGVTGFRFPGNADMSPGSPFNEPDSGAPGTGTGGTVYAGNGPGSMNANSGNAVSQYDVACTK